MRQLIAAPIRMIVGATLPSARVGEGLETTQLGRCYPRSAATASRRFLTFAPSPRNGEDRTLNRPC